VPDQNPELPKWHCHTIPPSGAGMLCSPLRKKMFAAAGCPAM